ncbi:MAG: methylenetetrahydrofolate--tRNA-(uracil(54)-C(5))-methyltransferase (FADH(2)-oxidizing) TrmFO [Deltaproteobacteria bacterium]|nr:methylenetetrahydrofolate--tRNA-(uracil(54)-C(5))-methyltransferase (FADH(2)-oxidizing) TrmFO [Deltaproteobacteria bacterium]
MNLNNFSEIHVVGAGLAGSECALQLAKLLGPNGFKIVLHEMRGSGSNGVMVTTPAHRTEDCAELVCSNSFGSLASHAAPGLLKWEAEHLGSEILSSAIEARVPAGQALGMDREVFARLVTEKIKQNPYIEIRRELITSLDQVPRPTVIATGPLTHESLAQSMQSHFELIRSTDGNAKREFLYFYDAIAPIIAADSINAKVAWKADRWDKGTKDYWNCPLTKKEYHFFIDAVRDAKKIEAKDFEKDFDKTPYFESCMPIEAILERGPKTLRFGPMSPKGLIDPRTGNTPYAVVQLRQDNREGTAYNMVGFQTKMAYGDQKKVFRLIPGLEEAEFLKLGSIHRNLYLNTPRLLNRDLSSKADPWLFFAGQITGVEGYFESTCMGLLVARFLSAKIEGLYSLDACDLGVSVNSDGENLLPPRTTALGSLHAAITDETKISHFQPTNINFGHMPDPHAFSAEAGVLGHARIDKRAKRLEQIRVAKASFVSWVGETAPFRSASAGSKVERAAHELAQYVTENLPEQSAEL